MSDKIREAIEDIAEAVGPLILPADSGYLARQLTTIFPELFTDDAA